MKLLSVAYYTAVRNVKDIKTLLLIIASLVMIAILGISLDQLYAPANLGRAEVAFFDADRGAAAGQFLDFLGYDQVSELIDVQAVEDYDTGLALLDEGRIESFIHLPPGFTAALQRGERAEIEVLSRKSGTIVKSLVENYTHMANCAYAVAAVGGSIALPVSAGGHIEQAAITTDGKVPRGIDYYAVQTLLQVLILGAFFGIAAVREDEEKKTLVRINSAPVKPYEMLAGRTLANILVLFSAAVIVMAFSRYVYKANWGGNLGVNLLVVFIFLLLVVGLGMLLGVMINNTGNAMGVLVALMMFFSVVAGAITKNVSESYYYGILAKFSPNHYAATALFNNIYAGSPELIRSSIITLLLITVGIYALTLLVGRRKLL